MLIATCVVIIVQAIFMTAAPADPVLGKFSNGLRYDYMETDDGDLQLVDNWLKLSDYFNLARYNPDESNRYYLFTRSNPSVGHVLVMNDATNITNSYYDSSKRTVILFHGFAGSAASRFNTDLIPAFLAGDDCNVIVLDWSAGSFWGPRAIQAAEAGARFANWLMSVTGTKPYQFTIVGYSVAGHGVGIMGRNMDDPPGYIISCDPAHRWNDADVLLPTDGIYTEVIHTSIGAVGMERPLGDVDFYPNGGRQMPGCFTSVCDHERSYRYIAESMEFGGFLGTRCSDLTSALTRDCNLSETLNMGGILPKTGRTGIFFLRTGATFPFSL